jgi:hypothetical protein
MSRIFTHATSACLIGMGVLCWAFAGRPLVKDTDLSIPLNPLGINGSPYGEVFAMAMQGPIDTYFHGSMSGGAHHHEAGETCGHCQKAAAPARQEPTAKHDLALATRFSNFLASLDKAAATSTNPKAASQAHKLYLRRQVEDKLRFAYQLDPSHYGNYNALHFFLTEPQLGTRPELTPSAAKLAGDTIQYCLKQDKDPRPALTAAAAATNLLQLMFADQKNDKPQFNTTQMRQYLGVLDYTINRYVTLAKEWEETKNWDLVSPQRIAECDERFTFICKIREAAEKTILRLEGKLQSQASEESQGLKVSKS